MRFPVNEDGNAPVMDRVISMLDVDDRHPQRTFPQVIFSGKARTKRRPRKKKSKGI